MNYSAKHIIYLGIFTTIASLVLFVHVFTEPTLTVAFLDVGQGDAIYLRTPRGRTMLIDGGKNREVLYEVTKVHPFYHRTIDVLAVSHPDIDHLGGLLPVLDQYEVTYVIDSLSQKESEAYDLFKEKVSGKILNPESGYVLSLEEGVRVEVLWPHASIPVSNDNEGSLVFRIEYQDTSVLLTGDIGFETETQLIDMYGRSLMSDILKVGHHGSRFSSSQEWINKVDPAISILSYGCENRYGHPHQEVVERLQKQGIVFDTCRDGTIIFNSNGVLWKKK